MADNIVDIGFSYKEAVEQARKGIEAELNSINTKIDLSDSFKEMESGIKKSLKNLNTELNKLSSKKINTSNYNNFKNSVSGHFTTLEKKVVAFQNKLDSLQVGINTSKLTTQFDTLKQSIENSNAALEKLISNSSKAGIKTAADKAKTKVTSSAEKDSVKTVQVHTELNTQIDALQAQLGSILSKLQKYADSKPIKTSVKITGTTDEQTKNALKQVESLSKAFNTSSSNIAASANQEVIALNTVVSKVRELQRSLNQIKNIQLPKLDINSITSDNSKSTKNSVSKEINAINRAAENSEKLSQLSVTLGNISTQLTEIDKCINVPNIFAGLKISKSNVDNIEKLSGAFDKIKVSLDGLSEGGFNFLQELGNISKQAESLKNLATILRESKGRSTSTKQTDEEKYQNKLNSRVNSLQNSLKGQDLTEYDSRLSANALESYRSRISNSTTMNELNAINKELDRINTNFSRAKKLKGDLLNGDFSNKKAANDFIEKYASNNGLTQLSLKENIIQDKNISQWIAQFKTAKGEIQNVTFTYDSLLKKMSQQTKTVTPNVNNLAQAFSKVKSRLADIATYWTAMYLNPYQIIGTIKQGINLVRDLDNALLDLKKTTTMSKSDLTSFYKDANKEAKELGVSTKQIIEQASSWSRLGSDERTDLLYGNI